MKHKATLTVHAVPLGSGGLEAVCGEVLNGGEHTGRFRPLTPASTLPGSHLCAACVAAS